VGAGTERGRSGTRGSRRDSRERRFASERGRSGSERGRRGTETRRRVTDGRRRGIGLGRCDTEARRRGSDTRRSGTGPGRSLTERGRCGSEPRRCGTEFGPERCKRDRSLCLSHGMKPPTCGLARPSTELAESTHLASVPSELGVRTPPLARAAKAGGRRERAVMGRGTRRGWPSPRSSTSSSSRRLGVPSGESRLAPRERDAMPGRPPLPRPARDGHAASAPVMVARGHVSHRAGRPCQATRCGGSRMPVPPEWVATPPRDQATVEAGRSTLPSAMICPQRPHEIAT
jgi:hypothetical protein